MILQNTKMFEFLWDSISLIHFHNGQKLSLDKFIRHLINVIKLKVALASACRPEKPATWIFWFARKTSINFLDPERLSVRDL